MLDHLPESLDDTYLHVLRQIPQANKEHAHRMLQCIFVAVRPLRVEELAEVLAFEFDEAQEGIPKYHATWQLDDQTQAVLSTCSSLVTIVDGGWDWDLYRRRQVVQFSHFSVKEFLMSNRLGDFSGYHIHPLSAHTIFTQACLGVLIHLDVNGNKKSEQSLPLATYAARYMVEHAQFEGVAPRVKNGLETLFDPDEPHFSAWLRIYDMEDPGGWYTTKPNPLYYAVLCGFYDLVEHLAIKHSQIVNATSGRYKFPLLAALEKDHIGIMELLLKHGADVNARDSETGPTILLKVLSRSQHNLASIVILLLKYGADVNARTTGFRSPLLLAEYRGELKVAQMLLEHKPDVNFQDYDGKTPLHILLECRTNNEDEALNHAPLLFERGAEVNRRDKHNQTPLLLALGRDWFKLMRILLERGADTNAQNYNGKTPLHILLECQTNNEEEALNSARLLFERGANVNRRDNDNETPLHLAMRRAWFKFAQILLEHGADATAEDYNGKTSLHILSESKTKDEGNAINHVFSLLKFGVDVNSRDKGDDTPLHLAIRRAWFMFAQVLLERGADATAENNKGKTPLHMLPESRTNDECNALNHALLLMEFGVDVNRRDRDDETPLHLAIRRAWFELARILLEHGADAAAQNNKGKTPLHILSESRINDEGNTIDHALLLLKLGVDVNKRDKDNETPLHMAVRWDQFKLTEILLEHGADVLVENKDGEMPLHILPKRWTCSEDVSLSHARSLLERGVEVNRRNKDGSTPLLLAMMWGRFTLAQILLQRGADANAEDNNSTTPLHLLSQNWIRDQRDVLDIIFPLLQHGASVKRQDKNNQTPSFLAIGRNWFKLARILLEHESDTNEKDNSSKISVGVHVKKRDHPTPLYYFSATSLQGRFVFARALLVHGDDKTKTKTDIQHILDGIKEGRPEFDGAHITCL